jgi:Flp pilus assembly protein TadG
MRVHPVPRISSAARTQERGQILVIFVLGLVAMVAMVGLVIDGGSAFAQRRDQQNVADLAAMAGATAYLNAPGDAGAKTAAAEAAARSIAATNGYTDQSGGATVSVAVTSATGTGAPDLNGARVAVDLGAPHRNYFSGLVGMPTWPVAVDAAALTTGRPNAVLGAMPLIFNQEAFPGAVCNEQTTTCAAEVYNQPNPGNEDVPQDATQFNWTVFCTATGNPCNANSDLARDMIEGNGSSVLVTLGMDIGPFNSGAHTTLFAALVPHIGSSFPVAIVDDEGRLVGFALFRLTGVEGGSDKILRGYFISPVNAADFNFVPGGGTSTISTGVSVIKLVD